MWGRTPRLLALVVGVTFASGAVAAEDPSVSAAGTEDSTAEQSAVVITAESSTAAASDDGPTVELITGGNSTNGSARVSKMPVLD